MALNTLDWVIIAANFLIVLLIGLWAARRAGKDTRSYFLSGRTMPWWLLGASMVATTFSTDTPNFVTNVVRKNGVAGNWDWWAFLVTGMVTVFVYARLWRRSGVMTDMEFYEIRYDGASAAFLRGFRAVYLGLLFNVIVLAMVCLAAIKIGQIMLGLSPLQTIIIASVVTGLFASAGGFLGVLITDLILFVTAMVGSVLAAWYALQHPDVGGLSGLMANQAVADKLRLVPAVIEDGKVNAEFITLLFIPLAVQWWATWYPGAEPGGGGYVAQRMLAAKNENHALGATLLFNVAHYALRPWPWILVALCSIIVYPELSDIQAAFPSIVSDKLGHDSAYPAMLTFLPHGVLGLVVASLMAAFMSTVSTHLNWGASYIVHDCYKRFVRPDATEREQVWAGRGVTVITMILAAAFSLVLTSAKQIFDIVIMFGAGSGLIFLLRWFWWRINAPAEIAAMIGSGCVAAMMSFTRLGEWIPDPWDFPVAVAITTVIWIVAMFLTRPTKQEHLQAFVRRLQPSGPGWRRIRQSMTEPQSSQTPTGDSLSVGLTSAILGCIAVYSTLFSIGWMLYGQWLMGLIALAIAAVSSCCLLYLAMRLRAGRNCRS